MLYTALGGTLPFSEQPHALQDFILLFQLDDRLPVTTAEQDFEQELCEDAAELIGREHELKIANEAIKQTHEGVLWIGGPGGIGKSYLMAKLACVLTGYQDTLRIAWRFKADDGARGTREAFLTHAVRKLAKWLGETITVDQDPDERLKQLQALLANVPTDVPASKNRRVIFVLDGLDEITRRDPGFPSLPFRMNSPGVVWVCAGRPEGMLQAVFIPDRCMHIFPNGLPPMTDADIRGMLIDGAGQLKYDLLALDQEKNDAVRNAAVEAVVMHAEGLPLYVRFVVEDLCTGHFIFADLADKLPPSLSAYYNDLLEPVIDWRTCSRTDPAGSDTGVGPSAA